MTAMLLSIDPGEPTPWSSLGPWQNALIPSSSSELAAT